MNEYLFGKDKIKGGSVIALGGFDGVHLGHRFIIEQGQKIARENNLRFLIFTLDGDLSWVNSAKSGIVYTYGERLDIFAELAVNGVIRALFTNEFSELSAEVFLNKLKTDFNAECFLCGSDYTFGKNASGNAQTLKAFCDKNGIAFKQVEFLCINNEKISARTIKSALKNGDVKSAAEFLGANYFIKGTVTHGREQGRKLGFPTANIGIEESKLKLKNGVYVTHADINGKRYIGVTNYGGAPTFGVQKLLVETHFIDFNGDIYGKRIKLYFDEFIRCDFKFESAEQLKNRLFEDVKFARSLFNASDK